MGVTFRAVVIGLLLVPLNAMWLALGEQVWYSGEPTTLSIYANVLMIQCIIVVINSWVKRWRPATALDAREIMLIYIMLTIGTSLGGHDMIPVLLPTICYLPRYNLTDGRYRELMNLAPDWLTVNDADALRSAYVGQESIFSPQNFIPWLQPLFWWFLFTMALCAVMWGLNLLFRKQWTEHEKLAYPIIQVPMILGEKTHLLAGSRIFWMGFLLAAGIDAINGLNVLFPLLPKIPIVQVSNVQTLFTERPWTDMGLAWISFFPCIIGLCFFMPLDLAFSCWFFFIMWKMMRVLASHVGVVGMPGFPFVQEQALGGYYAIAFTALWITRRQLARMWRLLLGRDIEGATLWERREARLAAILIVGGLTFLYLFCWMAGMSHSIIIPFFIMYYLMAIGITRMRAELGPPSHDLYPVGAHRQLVNYLGGSWLGKNNPHDIAMFGFLNWFNRCQRSHPMPQGMEGFRIAERLGMSYQRLFWVMMLTIAVATLSSYFSLTWAYTKYGLTAQTSPLPDLFGMETWEAANMWLVSPQRHINAPAIATLIGLLTTAGLAFLRMNLIWWPFHPVGFAISASYTMERMWFPLFIAWLIKALILKYGGAKAYQPASFFFVGLMLGDFVGGGFWFTYGMIMETKVYHFWPY